MVPAGTVLPGASNSVEIFTADLLIPEPGLHVTFTHKPPPHYSPTSLELWCWMEPSNTAGFTAAGASLGADASSLDTAAPSASAAALTAKPNVVTADTTKALVADTAGQTVGLGSGDVPQSALQGLVMNMPKPALESRDERAFQGRRASPGGASAAADARGQNAVLDTTREVAPSSPALAPGSTDKHGEAEPGAGARVLAMLQPQGALIVTTDGQGSQVLLER